MESRALGVSAFVLVVVWLLLIGHCDSGCRQAFTAPESTDVHTR